MDVGALIHQPLVSGTTHSLGELNFFSSSPPLDHCKIAQEHLAVMMNVEYATRRGKFQP